MPLILLALFIAVPLAEISVFIAAGNTIGLFPTIATVVVTAVIGTFLLQKQGLSAMARTQQDMAAGKMPIESMMDGVYLLVAGAFLLTPGFITDAIGFLLFVPPFRRWLGKAAFKRMMRNADIHVSTSGKPHRSDQPKHEPGVYTDGQGPIIDGEYEDIEDKPDSAHSAKSGKTSKSPWRGPSRPR